MSVSVRLQVEGVDLTQEATLEAIAASDLALALWATVDGVQTATVYPESDDITSEVLRFARLLTCRIRQARVVRVHRDLVSASDIAHRTGFSRETVRKWASGSTERSFPAPFGAVGEDSRTSKIWLWPEVARWLAANYKFPVDVDWPDESTVAHIEACLQKVPDYATQEWHAIQVSWTGITALRNLELHTRASRMPLPQVHEFVKKLQGAMSEQDEVVGA
ncbi:hypothetical protein IU459_08160 [Nocardia amamiensis]|uniref:Helix-turn-helix domain-containing protein n=1 Tax=Nocardia amamiensis TaxID=404578 RepID=A0ABS0CLQ4_9NOCA|nr:hypothetical protein [Nocardia amamiensis]MBF6297516.1 hypothetical protein [Nocardia amamiensis]